MTHYAKEIPVDWSPWNTEDESGIEPEDFESHATSWDKEFLASMDYVLLIRVLLAAQMLDIRPLYDLCCVKMSLFLRNKCPDEVENELGIPPNSLDPELREQFIKENTFSTKKKGVILTQKPAREPEGAGAVAGAGVVAGAGGAAAGAGGGP